MKPLLPASSPPIEEPAATYRETRSLGSLWSSGPWWVLYLTYAMGIPPTLGTELTNPAIFGLYLLGLAGVPYWIWIFSQKGFGRSPYPRVSAGRDGITVFPDRFDADLGKLRFFPWEKVEYLSWSRSGVAGTARLWIHLEGEDLGTGASRLYEVRVTRWSALVQFGREARALFDRARRERPRTPDRIPRRPPLRAA